MTFIKAGGNSALPRLLSGRVRAAETEVNAPIRGSIGEPTLFFSFAQNELIHYRHHLQSPCLPGRNVIEEFPRA